MLFFLVHASVRLALGTRFAPIELALFDAARANHDEALVALVARARAFRQRQRALVTV